MKEHTMAHQTREQITYLIEMLTENAMLDGKLDEISAPSREAHRIAIIVCKNAWAWAEAGLPHNVFMDELAFAEGYVKKISDANPGSDICGAMWRALLACHVLVENHSHI